MKFLKMLAVVALIIPLANVFSAPVSASDPYDDIINKMFVHENKDTAEYCRMAKSQLFSALESVRQFTISAIIFTKSLPEYPPSATREEHESYLLKDQKAWDHWITNERPEGDWRIQNAANWATIKMAACHNG